MKNKLHVNITKMRLFDHVSKYFELVSFDNEVVVLRWLHSNISDMEVLLECEPILTQSKLDIITHTSHADFSIALRFNNPIGNVLITSREQSAMLSEAKSWLDGEKPCAGCTGMCDFEIVL